MRLERFIDSLSDGYFDIRSYIGEHFTLSPLASNMDDLTLKYYILKKIYGSY